MKIGICENSFIPLRAGMSHKSEMLNQILFGELFEITIHRTDWSKIRLIHDNYEGWVDTTTITVLDEKDEISADYIFDKKISSSRETKITLNSKQSIFILAGSVLHTENDDKEFSINGNKYYLPKDFSTQESIDKRKLITENAMTFINAPYLWGGRTAWGIDCSGFTQLMYRLAGINIQRDASQQIKGGNTLNFLSEAQAGDLAFFDNEDGEIVHVGIILDSTSIIHASGKVRIDTIDHQGIYNKSLKRYTHELRVIKSLI